MATQVQWRRGTTAQVAAFTGAVGEVVVDTSTWQMSVQDGVTPGGHYTGLATGGTFSNITITGLSNVLTGTMTTSGLGTFTNVVITNPTVTTGTFASPALTGSPTVVTPALTANNTLIPNTTWVRQVIQLTSPINMGLLNAQPLLA